MVISSGALSTDVPFFLISTVSEEPVGSDVRSIVNEFRIPALPATNPPTVVENAVPPWEYWKMGAGPPPLPVDTVKLTSEDSAWLSPFMVTVREVGTAPTSEDVRTTAQVCQLTLFTAHPHAITTFQLPRREVQLTVLMFVQETRVDCFVSKATVVASLTGRADSSARYV